MDDVPPTGVLPGARTSGTTGAGTVRNLGFGSVERKEMEWGQSLFRFRVSFQQQAQKENKRFVCGESKSKSRKRRKTQSGQVMETFLRRKKRRVRNKKSTLHTGVWLACPVSGQKNKYDDIPSRPFASAIMPTTGLDSRGRVWMTHNRIRNHQAASSSFLSLGLIHKPELKTKQLHPRTCA